MIVGRPARDCDITPGNVRGTSDSGGMDEEKLSRKDRNSSQIQLLGPRKYDRFLRELNDGG
jgi:hypothetical protein